MKIILTLKDIKKLTKEKYGNVDVEIETVTTGNTWNADLKTGREFSKGLEGIRNLLGNKSRHKKVRKSKNNKLKGFLKYDLSGRSVAQLRDDGVKFCSEWHKGDGFEKKTTKPCKIIITKDFYIKDSFNKTVQKQKSMVNGLQPVGKYKSVILEANEMCELIWLHYKKTGEWITGNNWVRTITLNDSGRRVYVRGHPVHGVGVDHWHDGACSRIGVAASRKFES